MTQVTETLLRSMLAEAAQQGTAPAHVEAFYQAAPQPTLAELAVPSVAGKTVLDVGSNIGLRCFEAAQQGAARVVGIDVNPVRVEQARALARMLEFDVEFRCLDADAGLPDLSADIVLCSSVLNRSAAPAALLQKLAALAQQQLILCVAGPDAPQFASLLKEHGVRSWQLRVLQRLPVVLVGRAGPTIRWPESRFALTPAGIRNLLLYQNARFADVSTRAVSGAGYYCVTATRRCIEHLLVISGISGVGKTTFVNWLKENGAAAERLFGIGDFASWTVIEPIYYPTLTDPYIPRLCLHNDLSRGLRYPARAIEGDIALQLLQEAMRVTCLTLWAPYEVIRERKQMRMSAAERSAADRRGLLARLAERLRSAIGRRGFTGRRAARWRAQQEWDQQLLAHPELIREHYREWIRYCDRIQVSAHWVIDTSQDYRPVRADQFAPLQS